MRGLADPPTFSRHATHHRHFDVSSTLTSPSQPNRPHDYLAGQQKSLVKAALDAASPGTRVLLLLFNGGTIALEELLLDTRLAIVECWFPGATGGTAIANAVFGTNKFGKLPVTYYAYNYTEASVFEDMNMTTGVGRTYKYLTDDSLAEFPFGFGLSYTTFELEQAALEKSTAGHKVRLESRPCARSCDAHAQRRKPSTDLTPRKHAPPPSRDGYKTDNIYASTYDDTPNGASRTRPRS